MKDIPLTHILEFISNFIDTGLAKSEKMLEFHKRKGFKNYSHSGFKELETDKIYKADKIYSFSVRCIDGYLKDYFAKILPITHTRTLKGLVTTVKPISKIDIDKLYTLTPALIKLEQGYWKGNIDLHTYYNMIIENSVKKAKSVIGNFDEDFDLFSDIKILNKTPVATRYKNISLLGDKLELNIANNDMAQKIAYILLGTGICENCSRGYGFVNYKSG
ncbi:MAG TPA: CRISPR-associated endoribonuclease Cas6 [Mobilitalea sp.]|nr:CRISPR-associated endoribonuclease Cas6 [Mobilitalea sp.]